MPQARRPEDYVGLSHASIEAHRLRACGRERTRCVLHVSYGPLTVVEDCNRPVNVTDTSARPDRYLGGFYSIGPAQRRRVYCEGCPEYGENRFQRITPAWRGCRLLSRRVPSAACRM